MNQLCRQCLYVYELTAEYPITGQLHVLLYENCGLCCACRACGSYTPGNNVECVAHCLGVQVC
jgi:hypothetical protein